MIYLSVNWGISAWNYNVATDEREWSLTIGFGGPAKREPGTWRPPYRYGTHIVWRKLSNCVTWRVDYLGVERGRGVVVQYRVCGFRHFPIGIEIYKAPA